MTIKKKQSMPHIYLVKQDSR